MATLDVHPESTYENVTWLGRTNMLSVVKLSSKELVAPPFHVGFPNVLPLFVSYLFAVLMCAGDG